MGYIRPDCHGETGGGSGGISVVDFSKAGWLTPLLNEAVATHVGAPAPEASVPSFRPGRARARAYLRGTLRASGLLYGTPADPPASLESEPATEVQARALEDQLFHAVVRTLAALALELARQVGAPDGPRGEQLLVFFAVLGGELALAESLAKRLVDGKAVTKRQVAKVEAALRRREPTLAGDPVYGLVLHNGAQYADAQLFCRQAIDFFATGRFRKAQARRRLDFAARQKALLVDVLTGLACVDRQPGTLARRAILKQVEDLRLPAATSAELKAAVKQSFERRRSVRDVVRRVRGQDMRHFLLEQTLLAALVDGRRTRRERAFIDELADALQVSKQELRRLELEMAEFYTRHRSVVDVFTVSDAAGAMGDDLVASMQETLEKNFHRLMQEVRETGDLAVLLTKAARGQKLTSDERKRMRAQLIDVAKAIPALAIFAAPGGILLLAALAKVLPFSLLPSSFQDESPTPEQDDVESEEDFVPEREVG
ncbi:LETM1 domain-containing protein [Myxococcus stipitatus]|uniref:TerB family tellurite resistance protein n=1 Tax=Myxococcus stipitatus TaxID=83455 RepID=UPI001F1DAA35|nr:TerB family tellurite resistance protein [Myxococcus stipitatus]MCE9669455.1 LETM1 domain-containing protein [Myxococcus stipitatus]